MQEGSILHPRGKRDKVRAARELRRTPTPAERALWAALRGNQLRGLHVRRQQVIEGFIVDFYCHAARLVIEVDGLVHDQQSGHDSRRDEVLAARGLLVVRVMNADVLSRLPAVLDRIVEHALPRLAGRQQKSAPPATQIE